MVPPLFGLNGNTRTNADSAARGDRFAAMRGGDSIRDSRRSEAARFFLSRCGKIPGDKRAVSCEPPPWSIRQLILAMAP
jgi:hypothetical protein